MRKLLYFFSALILICSSIACQKEVTGEIIDPNVTPAGNNGILKAKINGVQWVANNFASASRLAGLINISGRSSDGKLLTITLTDSGIHRYTLIENAMHAAAYVDSASGNPNAYTTNQGTIPGQGGGELTITSIDTAKKTLTGTFSFKVFRQQDSGQVSFTEGSFTDLKYVVTLQSSNATDTFRVKIDNVLFTPPSILAAAVMGRIAISGNEANGSKTVGLQFPADVVPGTYTFDFLGLYTALYISDPNSPKAAFSGTLTILEHNITTKRVRGNFAFLAEEFIGPLTANLTEGYFSVKYN